MTREELHKELENNRKEIERVSDLIDNLHQLKELLEKDTDLYYKLLKIENAAEYGELVRGYSERNCMKIYEISADCLVDFYMLYWYVEAENEEDAWNKGYEIVNTTNIADSGSVNCKEVESLPEGATIWKKGVKPIEREIKFSSEDKTIYADTDSAAN